MKKYNVAIVGATGLVGLTFLKVLEEYRFPVNKLFLFASKKSKGKKITFKQNVYTVDTLKKGCFSGVDIALFSAGAFVSKKWATEAEKSGATVIDNSSAWRMGKNNALIVPEVNFNDITGKSKIIANPNCSTIQTVIPLKALSDKFGIKRVNFTTFQAVSGSGQKGKNDLTATLNGEKPSFYPYDISKTCIPQIGEFLPNGYSEEEMKMVNETKKILHLNTLKISATCVRVPIFNSHAVAVSVQLKKAFTVEEVKNAFSNQEGIVVLDDRQNAVYPVSTVANGTDKVYVGRIRKDISTKNGLLFYVVADNIRKGAASNAVQIAKKLIEKGVI